LFLLAGCGGLGGTRTVPSENQSTPTQSLQKSVNHIIFMAQENRSFDTYLGHLNDYRTSQGLPADVDGMPADASNPNDPAGPHANQGPVSAFHLKTMCIENTSADWATSHINFNYWNPASNTPVMDGFVAGAAAAAYFEGLHDTLGLRAMGYYTAEDLPYHYWLASQFATSDRWFAAAPVETEPNRMYFVAATSAGHAHKPAGGVNARTIFDLLQDAGISWKVYATDTDPATGKPITILYDFPIAARHPTNIVPISQYFDDLKNGTLPAVALIEPGYLSGQDEHPGAFDNIQTGAAYSASLINALMSSSFWKDSVFILTFDESGGLYDHVPSPTTAPSPDGIAPSDLSATEPRGDFTRYGFRVPLIVVSPFAKQHYVSHTSTDFTAVLKFIETRFTLANLTQRDAAAMDMTEFFDFAAPPLLTPPTPPAQPQNGRCDSSLP
jgi:phospholipase C